MKCKLLKGMIVTVLSGKDKGKQGKILRVIPKNRMVVIEGVNIIKRAMRPNKNNPNGGILEKESPMPVSRVAPIDPETKTPCRIKITEKDGVKLRISHKSGKVIV